MREEITPKLQDLVPGDILDEFDVVLVGEGVDPSVEFERALGGVETRRRSRGNSMNLAFGATIAGLSPSRVTTSSVSFGMLVAASRCNPMS